MRGSHREPKGDILKKGWLTPFLFYLYLNLFNKLKNNNMNFGQAIEALKEGKKVAREGWNGKGMFLTYVPGYFIDKKDLFNRSNVDKDFIESCGLDGLTTQGHIDMWTAQATLCVGWLASQADMLSEDWVIVE